MPFEILNFGNHKLLLYPNGELYWSDQKTVVVSDLHLEKGSFYATSNQFIPPYDTIETLRKLQRFLNQNCVEKIIFLGDLVHDSDGFSRISDDALKLFNEILKNREAILTVGNHDKNFKYNDYCLKFCDEYRIEDIYFRHQPNNTNDLQIFGHFHPKIVMKIMDKKLSKKCFISNKEKILMPAYGTLTGGLEINSSPIKDLFFDSFTTFPINDNKIFKLQNTT